MHAAPPISQPDSRQPSPARRGTPSSASTLTLALGRRSPLSFPPARFHIFKGNLYDVSQALTPVLRCFLPSKGLIFPIFKA